LLTHLTLIFSLRRPPGPAFGWPEDRLRPVPMADMDPACEAVRNLAHSSSYPSFPRKREPRDFSGLPPCSSQGQALGPRVRGDDELVCSQDFLTASCAGKKRMLAPCFPDAFGSMTASAQCQVRTPRSASVR